MRQAGPGSENRAKDYDVCEQANVFHTITVRKVSLPNVARDTPLLVRRGGRDLKKNVAEPPLKKRTGWSLTQTVSVSDHPACAASVASRHFITGAATPPHEEGNTGSNIQNHSNSCESGALVVAILLYENDYRFNNETALL